MQQIALFNDVTSFFKTPDLIMKKDVSKMSPEQRLTLFKEATGYLKKVKAIGYQLQTRKIKEKVNSFNYRRLTNIRAGKISPDEIEIKVLIQAFSEDLEDFLEQYGGITPDWEKAFRELEEHCDAIEKRHQFLLDKLVAELQTIKIRMKRKE